MTGGGRAILKKLDDSGVTVDNADRADIPPRWSMIHAGRPVAPCSVDEEDLENDPIRAYRRCCEFLEVEPQPVSIPTAKTTPFPLSEVLMNFDEVAASLKGTRFEWMLRD